MPTPQAYSNLLVERDAFRDRVADLEKELASAYACIAEGWERGSLDFTVLLRRARASVAYEKWRADDALAKAAGR